LNERSGSERKSAQADHSLKASILNDAVVGADTASANVLIRLVGDTDQAEWLRLRQALWPGDSLAEHACEMNAICANLTRQPVFVAEAPAGGLCGLLEVAIHTSAEGCTTDNVGYLEGWFVEPSWRGQGIGRALVAGAEAWARAQGCTEMASDTTLDYPLSPLAHARLGYQETSRRFHYRKDLA
jgi:aminoglycoside 6'-N-acetyltransferase I